jgi:hypothetical protein
MRTAANAENSYGDPSALRKLAALDDDFGQRRMALVDVPSRTALRLADVSGQRIPSLACRTLDILHVASAIALKRRYFLTFDSRQRKLAQAVGLKTIALE